MFSPAIHNKTLSALDTLSLAATALTGRERSSPNQGSSSPHAANGSSAETSSPISADAAVSLKSANTEDAPSSTSDDATGAADNSNTTTTNTNTNDPDLKSSPTNSSSSSSSSNNSSNNNNNNNNTPPSPSSHKDASSAPNDQNITNSSSSSTSASNLALLSNYASKGSEKEDDDAEVYSTPKSGEAEYDDDKAQLKHEGSELAANDGSDSPQLSPASAAREQDPEYSQEYGQNSSLPAIHPSLAAMSTDSNIYSTPTTTAEYNANGQYNQYYQGYDRQAQGQGAAAAGGSLNLMSIACITSPNTSNRALPSMNGRTTLPSLQSISPSANYLKPLGSPEEVYDPKFTSNGKRKSYSGMYETSNQVDGGLSPQSWSQRQSASLMSPDNLPPVSSLNNGYDTNGYHGGHMHTTTSDLPHGMALKTDPAISMIGNGMINSNGKRLNEYHHHPSTGGSGTSRKKRQCTECHGWFSNLATHRSIHMANNSRPHTCEVCKRGFARPNDLFRHQKSHRGDAPFRCPLFVRGPLTHGAFGNLEPACHQNGGFSRCDTYKNHLKAMHFEYPPGTKKKMRNGTSGKCKACHMPFESSDQWIAQHIESGACKVIQQIKEVSMNGNL